MIRWKPLAEVAFGLFKKFRVVTNRVMPVAFCGRIVPDPIYAALAQLVEQLIRN